MSLRSVRSKWMRMMGRTHEEIKESLKYDPPTILQNEHEQLMSAFSIQKMNKRFKLPKKRNWKRTTRLDDLGDW